MKNKFKFLTAISALFLLSGCYSVPTGYVGLKVNLYGDGKGSIESVPPGRYWDTPNIEYHKFPTYLQNVVWTQSATEGSPGDDSVTFQTSEGLSVNADVGFSYSVNPERAIDIFKSHRKGIDAITNIYLRNIIRDSFNTAASTRGVEHIYGKGKSEFIVYGVKPRPCFSLRSKTVGQGGDIRHSQLRWDILNPYLDNITRVN